MNEAKSKQESDYTYIASVFKAMCDPKRISILRMLQQSEHCACDLMDRTGIMQSTLSYHMKVLIEANLVDSWNKGKWTYYKISETGKKELLMLLDEIIEIKDVII